MTSIIRADNISTVAGTGTIAVQAGNTLDASAGFTAPAGHVIQVVTGSTQTSSSTTSTSYVDVTNLSLVITPSSVNSKIYLYASVELSGSGTMHGQTALYRGSTKIVENAMGRVGNVDQHTNLICLDTPSTTSEITYKVRFKAESGDTAVVNQQGSIAGDEFTSFITAMEISA